MLSKLAKCNLTSEFFLPLSLILNFSFTLIFNTTGRTTVSVCTHTSTSLIRPVDDWTCNVIQKITLPITP